MAIKRGVPLIILQNEMSRGSKMRFGLTSLRVFWLHLLLIMWLPQLQALHLYPIYRREGRKEGRNGGKKGREKRRQTYSFIVFFFLWGRKILCRAPTAVCFLHLINDLARTRSHVYQNQSLAKTDSFRTLEHLLGWTHDSLISEQRWGFLVTERENAAGEITSSAMVKLLY